MLRCVGLTTYQWLKVAAIDSRVSCTLPQPKPNETSLCYNPYHTSYINTIVYFAQDDV